MEDKGITNLETKMIPNTLIGPIAFFLSTLVYVSSIALYLPCRSYEGVPSH